MDLAIASLRALLLFTASRNLTVELLDGLALLSSPSWDGPYEEALILAPAAHHHAAQDRT
jgi:hypothetical protein